MPPRMAACTLVRARAPRAPSPLSSVERSTHRLHTSSARIGSLHGDFLPPRVRMQDGARAVESYRTTAFRVTYKPLATARCHLEQRLEARSRVARSASYQSQLRRRSRLDADASRV